MTLYLFVSLLRKSLGDNTNCARTSSILGNCAIELLWRIIIAIYIYYGHALLKKITCFLVLKRKSFSDLITGAKFDNDAMTFVL